MLKLCRFSLKRVWLQMQFGVFIPLMGLSLGQSPRWKMLDLEPDWSSGPGCNPAIKCVQHWAELPRWLPVLWIWLMRVDSVSNWIQQAHVRRQIRSSWDIWHLDLIRNQIINADTAQVPVYDPSSAPEQATERRENSFCRIWISVVLLGMIVWAP